MDSTYFSLNIFLDLLFFSAVVMFYQCIALNEGQKDKRMVELLKNKLPKKKKFLIRDHEVMRFYVILVIL